MIKGNSWENLVTGKPIWIIIKSTTHNHRPIDGVVMWIYHYKIDKNDKQIFFLLSILSYTLHRYLQYLLFTLFVACWIIC